MVLEPWEKEEVGASEKETKEAEKAKVDLLEVGHIKMIMIGVKTTKTCLKMRGRWLVWRKSHQVWRPQTDFKGYRKRTRMS